MSENRKIRVFYQFNGYVQGVGFRYRMSHLAGYFGVTGWVRNEYDGSVQAELQGLPEEIDMIIQRLCQIRYIEILQHGQKRTSAGETEPGLHVKY